MTSYDARSSKTLERPQGQPPLGQGTKGEHSQTDLWQKSALKKAYLAGWNFSKIMAPLFSARSFPHNKLALLWEEGKNGMWLLNFLSSHPLRTMLEGRFFWCQTLSWPLSWSCGLKKRPPHLHIGEGIFWQKVMQWYPLRAHAKVPSCW